MSPPPPLEEPYRSAALAPDSARYLGWLFAAPAMRDPLLGIFALLAEWRALSDPATEPAVAHVKLGWWREEIERLIGGRPVHPITRFLAALPGASPTAFAGLEPTLGAIHDQILGSPLESAAAFDRRAEALRAAPLLLVGDLGGGSGGDRPTQGLAAAAVPAGAPAQAASERSAAAAVGAFARAAHTADALASYRRQARAGRIVFPLESLRAAGVEPAALDAEPPPGALRQFLERLRTTAAGQLASVADSIPRTSRPVQRHLAVLAAIERRRLYAEGLRPRTAALIDLWCAWRAARRASRR